MLRNCEKRSDAIVYGTQSGWMSDNPNKSNATRTTNKILTVCCKLASSVPHNLVPIKWQMNMSIDERNISCPVLKCVVS